MAREPKTFRGTTMETYQIVIDVLINNGVLLSAAEETGIKKAFSSRGPYKGYLKKSCPKRDDTLARAVWLAIQPNVYKISIGSVFMLPNNERNTFDKLNEISFPYVLDKDMKNLKDMGVW